MKETLKALVLFFTIGEAVKEAISDDGKIDWMESMDISMKAIGLVPVFKNLKKIGEELKNSTNEQRLELEKAFAEKFHLSNEVAELKVKTGIAFMVQLVNMIFPKEVV